MAEVLLLITLTYFGAFKEPHGTQSTFVLCSGQRAVIKCFSFLKFLLACSCFTMLCQFLLYSKVNQPYVYMYLLFFILPSLLDHHRVLSRVPCAMQQALTSYLLYTQQCIYVNTNLPIHPTPTFPPQYPYVYPLCLLLCFCFANRFICSEHGDGIIRTEYSEYTPGRTF